MKTSIDCIPCLVRQALDAARRVSPDAAFQEVIVRDVLQRAATMEWQRPPPVLAQWIHRRLREMAGVADPYRAAKTRQTHMALALLPALEKQVAGAADPLMMAVRLAIAGNVIDLGATPGISEADLGRALRGALSAPFQGDGARFRRAVAEARSILYLADNAGEVVFDRLLIAQLPRGRVTVAVRGAPVINDATREDALAAGLAEYTELIDNGSDAPGTLLYDCSPDFRARYHRTDLIIAKGQGNFESLSDENKQIFFLFSVKCPVIAGHAGQPQGTHVLMSSNHCKTGAANRTGSGGAT